MNEKLGGDRADPSWIPDRESKSCRRKFKVKVIRVKLQTGGGAMNQT